MIINAGIKRVVYAGEYPDNIARQFLAEAGVSLQRMILPEEKREAVKHHPESKRDNLI
jgi:dCMP deaminase